MKVWVANNMFAGAIAKVEGKNMEFASDYEAYEYVEDNEDGRD